MYRKGIALVLAAALCVLPAGTAMADELVAESDWLCDDGEIQVADVPEQADGEAQEDGVIADDGASALTDAAVPEAAGDVFLQDDGLGGDAAVADSSQAAGDGSATDDSLILDIEEVTLESDLAVDDTVIADEVCTVKLSESGLAGDACAPLIRAYSARTSYVDSYGGQLDGEAAKLYSALVNAYMTNRGSGALTYTLSTSLAFDMSDGVVVQENGVNTMQWDSDNNTEYQAVASELKYAVQASYDALVYDYPEIFWMSAPTYQFSISFSGTTGSYTGKISSITWTPVEKYTGASSQIGAFDAAVESTYDQVNASLGGDNSYYNKVRVIHDYLCDNVTYQENDLAHTAAGVFLTDDKCVVCEGYAKSFMILCRRFGLESVLIPGGATTSGGVEGHMWNYVKMEDGNWYLVDATWDDQVTYISDTYFLAGNLTVGFRGITLYEERESNKYSNFSGSDNTFSFSFPELSNCKYHTEHTWGEAEYVGATSTACAIERRNCTVAGCDVVGETVYHEWDAGKVTKEATCTEAGITTYTCSRCGSTRTEEIQALGHDWDSGKVTKEATCTGAGITTYTCSHCGETKTEEIAALGHDWDSGKVTKEATCTEAGITTYTCSHCGRTRIEKIQALGHDWDSEKVTREATCTEAGITTYTCSHCGETKTEEIPAPGHNFVSEYTTDREATCEETGQESRHCSRCSAVTDLQVIPAKGHDYGDWVPVSKATALTEGREVHTCQVCGDVQEKAIARLSPTIALNVKSLRLKVGQSTTAVKVSGLAEGDSVVSWKSNKPKTVKVTRSGKITGKKVGNAVITVTLASGKTAEIKVKVQKTAVRTTKITGLPKKITLKKGQKVKLSPVISPMTSLQKVKYRSSNKKVAAVNGKGVVTAKKAGRTKITVWSGSKKVKITVVVSK